MSIVKRESKRRIDLDGPDGNAFFLLGVASKWAKQLKMDSKAIVKEMQSGDYKNLLTVFEKNFGSFVDLETDNPEYLSLFEPTGLDLLKKSLRMK